MKVVRWKAVWPLGLVTALVVIGWMLFLDPAVRWGVEDLGTRVVGARVDLREADVRITDGVVALHGLQVTNPNAPMTNLFEAEDLVVNVAVTPLLERKVVIDTVAVRGLRFGTPRETSGALPERPDTSATGGAFRAATAWASRVRVPPIELGTLTQAVNVDAIAPESLATLQAAQAARALADRLWTGRVAALDQLDPRPTIDSAQALATRLEGANLRSLGLSGARQAVTDIRSTISALTSLDDRLGAFQQQTEQGIGALSEQLAALPAARQADYAYARGLLRLPSLDAPALGPQLFSAPIAERVSQLLYWVQVLERYVPPGLERRFREGPDRVRASGTNVVFPREATYPTFLLRLAELSLALGGEGAAAGDYVARLTGITTQPSVYGAPATFLLARSAGQVGPGDIRLEGMLDHVTRPVRDTVGARLVGVSLPTLPIPGLGATLALGAGTTELALDRRGDSIQGRWTWRATNVRWARDTTNLPASPPVRLIVNGVWNAISRLDSVEIDARFSGSLTNPSLRISTNVATAVAGAFRAQLGEEVRRAEAQVRAGVDALVEPQVAAARTRAEEVRTDLTGRVARERQRLEQAKAALEAKLRELVRIPGIG